MKPVQIANAYKAIHELSNIVLPYHTSRQISRLNKRLTEEFETISNMEQNLLKEYQGKVKEDGIIQFKSTVDAKKFAEKYHQLMEQDESDISLPVVDLSKYTSIIHISADAVNALDGLIIFEKDEEE